ncbi:hypothetical protein GCM10029963_68100 [Micromonospora andamanensis]
MIGNLRHRPVRRLTHLFVGLVLYGFSMALMIRSGLGLNPWDVFHQGLSRLTGLSMGTVVIAVGALVLLAWIPLRQRPGLGTVANVVVIGLAVDATLALLPPGATAAADRPAGHRDRRQRRGHRALPRRPTRTGPRDGLMTGLVARHPGRSLRLVRTVIEIGVLAVGAVLGGTVGIGTIAYALSIGPLAQLFLPLFDVAEPNPRHRNGSRRPRPPDDHPAPPTHTGSGAPRPAASTVGIHDATHCRSATIGVFLKPGLPAESPHGGQRLASHRRMDLRIAGDRQRRRTPPTVHDHPPPRGGTPRRRALHGRPSRPEHSRAARHRGSDPPVARCRAGRRLRRLVPAHPDGEHLWRSRPSAGLATTVDTVQGVLSRRHAPGTADWHLDEQEHAAAVQEYLVRFIPMPRRSPEGHSGRG